MSLGAECPAVAWRARLGKPTAPVSALSPLPTWSAGCRSFKSFGQVLQAVFEISHHIVLLVNPALENGLPWRWQECHPAIHALVARGMLQLDRGLTYLFVTLTGVLPVAKSIGAAGQSPVAL